jgi:hypothetical protein
MSNPHPIGCCCWEDGWPTPTLEISHASDNGLLFAFGGTGYAGNDLFIEESWGNNPDYFYEDVFGPDRSGSITNSGAPANELQSCVGSCESYQYSHINNFVEDAEEYEEPKDKCWDWNEFTVEMDYNNITCATSIYNPAIQIPDPNNPEGMIPDPARICECGNWDTRSSFRTLICGFYTGNVATPPNPTYCPPQFYATPPSSGTNWCGGSVFDVNAPNITREFKKAFLDDGIVGRVPENLEFGDYYYVGGLSPTPSSVHLSRSKRDHRRNSRKVKMRVRFVVPPTCYLKVWTKVKITTRNTSTNSCFPDTQISETIQDLEPVEWIGTSENCSGASGYPYDGNVQTIDILNSLLEVPSTEFSFFEEGDLGVYIAPEEVLGVTAGHRKSMSFAFKYSMIPNYEPEWGCSIAYVDEIGDVCRVFDPFSEELTEQSCLNTNGLPTPMCHYV